MQQSTFHEFESISQCPVCNAGALEQAFPPDIIRCKDCGVLFRSPRPTQKAIQKSYDSDVTFSSWEAEREHRDRTWRRRLKLLQRFHEGTGRLLDVGCGDGHWMEVASEAGFQCEGSDFSSAAVERATRKGFRVHLGQFDEIPLGIDKFDVITLWHVLEHVPKPGDILKSLRKLLAPSGILVIAVPNEENKLFRHRSGLGNKNPLGELQFGHEIHLTHFQPSTLRKALSIAGFETKHFGVDDLYARRSLRNKAVVKLHRLLAASTGWHFGIAMTAVARTQRK